MLLGLISSTEKKTFKIVGGGGGEKGREGGKEQGREGEEEGEGENPSFFSRKLLQ